MDSVEYLVALDATVQELWNRLLELAPEAAGQLKASLAEVAEATDKAKRDLRSMGPGTHQIGEFAFQVKPGGEKVIFDIEDVLIEAEDGAHLDELISAGFIEYVVNPRQLERLPDMLKPIYQELGVVKQGTARVYMPKNLCK